jgi:biofilm PGA synthesis N-glycosyltransferase PgaC
MISRTKYVIITPVRDEEEHILKTLDSVTSQSVLPIQWVIVNDGSQDSTGSIIDDYSKQYHFIRTVHRENRGFRKSGGGVVEAFYDGYNCLESTGWDFIAKIDGDLSFEADYFERCFEKFAVNPKLGIGGGMVSHLINGVMTLEKQPLFHVRGATKIYKKDCWNAIGGLIKSHGWDTVDELKANMLGWETSSFEDLRVIHLRFTGAADGMWGGQVQNGLANYVSGYHPLFMAVKCVKRIFEEPYVIGSLGLFYGFLTGYLRKIPRVNDKALIDYVRREQLRRLFFGESIWK